VDHSRVEKVAAGILAMAESDLRFSSDFSQCGAYFSHGKLIYEADLATVPPASA
jgi:hypothetical protein